MSPQADYVVSNGTGAAVRSDINGQLAAIVSNNSGASAPATTYAYMLWADTSTNLLKLRNGANSAWITVGDLTAANLGLATLASPTFTGTATIPTLTVSTAANIPLGSAASPTLYFTGDSNTGLYSPGADQVALSTGGTGRLFIDSSGRCGIGTGSPAVDLQVNKSSDVSIALSNSSSVTSGNRASISCFNSSVSTVGLIRFGAVTDNVGTEIQFHTRPAAGSLTQSMTLDSSGRLGIGYTTPGNQSASASQLVVGNTSQNNGITILTGTTNDGVLNFNDGDNNSVRGYVIYEHSTDSLRFASNGSERFRCDSSGRVLVGTSTARANFFNSTFTSQVQIEGTTNDTASAALIRSSTDNGGTVLYFAKQRGSIGGNGIVASGDRIATLSFQGSDGSEFVEAAKIDVEVDGTPGANDMPGRLVFSTTADGASSPTERARITNGGILRVTQSGSYNEAANLDGHYFQNNNNQPNGFIAWNNSYTQSVFHSNCLRAANSAYNFYYSASGNGSTAYADTEFILRGDGNGYCDGSWSGGGADYAEYFEWSDGNIDEEDRRGISVVLDGNQIRPAEAGEDPIGVISGNPSVVGDAAWNKWVGKYLRDDYGSYILDENGNRQLNPAYDPDQEYVSREQRPEWDCVGLMGKLRIRKGQPTGSRWIKMRDISDSVEEWLVR